MSIVTQYWGSTQRILGASYLLSDSTILVEEGFVHASGTEYLSPRLYRVSDYNYSGPFTQTVDLNSEGLAPSLSTYATPYALQLQAANKYVNIPNFDFENGFDISGYNAEYSSTSSELALKLYTGGGNPTTTLTAKKVRNIKSGIIRTVMRSPSFASGASTMEAGIFFLGYQFRMLGAPTNQLRVRLFPSATSTGNTNVVVTSFTPANNTDYGMMFIIHESTIRAYTSTDMKAYTLQGSFDASDIRFPAGSVGLFASSSGTSTYMLMKNFEVYDFANSLSREDSIKKSFALGDVWGVTSANIINDFNGLTALPGSSWILGTSNNITSNFNVGGNSFNTMLSGESYYDFTVTVDAKWGASGVAGGLILGMSNHWWGGIMTAISNTSTLEMYNNARNQLSYTTSELSIIPNRWYSLKLVKSGAELLWYVNNRLSHAAFAHPGVSFTFYGISTDRLDYYDNGSTAIAVGIATLRSGASGQNIEFRNFRMPQLGQPVSSSIVVDRGENAGSILDRVLPLGYGINQEKDFMKVFPIGISSVGISLTSVMSINSSNASYSNNSGTIQNSIRSSGVSVEIYARSKSTRLNRQVGGGNYVYNSDDSLETVSDILQQITPSLVSDNKDIETLSLSMSARPTLEGYDKIDMSDTMLGISFGYLVYSQSKSFDVSSGQFNHTLQLGYGPSFL